jgi:tetratricopeptide (TPR) repeat protein
VGDPAFRQTLLGAADLAQRLGDTEQLVRAALANSQGVGAWAEVDPDRIAALEAALAAVGDADSAARARLLATLASQAILTTNFDRRVTMSDEAVAIARRLGDPLTLLQVLNLRFSATWVPETLDDRAAITAEAVALADELGEPIARFWARSWRQIALLESGDVDGARQCLVVMTAIADELRQPLLRSIEAQFRCGWSISAGDFAEAERLDAERNTLSGAVGVKEMASSYAWIFHIRWRQGRGAELIDQLASAQAESGSAGHRTWTSGGRPFASPLNQTALILLHAEAGQVDEARARLGEATAYIASNPSRLFTEGAGHLGTPVLLAEACALVGDDGQTNLLFELLSPFHNRPAFDAGTSLAVAHIVAVLAAKLGRLDEADAYFAEAESLNSRLPDPFYLARTHLEWGRMLLARRSPGDFQRGNALIERAQAAARQFGYAGVERSAAELLASPAARPDPPPLPARLAAFASGAFVGREVERRLLAERMAEVVGGRMRVVLVVGEPGIGKTALVADATSAARASGARVLYGRSDEDLRVPYQPFVESLRQLITQATDAVLEGIGARSLAEIARLIPEVRERKLNLPSPQASDPETERYLLMNAAVATFVAASDETPTILVLDDLQWADQSTLLLLRHLVSSAASARLLILATLREGTATAELRREPAVDQLTLVGLNDGEVAAMTGAAEELARTLHRETDGNPFFVGELFRHLTETGAGIPASVRGVISSRVSRLGADVVRTLATAAVIGQDFPLDLLTKVVDEDADRILDILERAESAALVRTLAPEHFAFTHALIQQALYEDLAPTRRSRLHRRVAEAIGVVSPDDARVMELARHWVEAAVNADEVAVALEHCRRAGDYALAAFRWENSLRATRRSR